MASDALSELPAEGWYAIIDGEQIGPVSRDAIVASVRAGQAGPDTYVWREGFAEWKQLSDVDGFAEFLAAVPTAAPDSAEGAAAPSTVGEAELQTGGMFDVPDAHPRRPLLHQRHDTSVLFSLDALDEGDSDGKKAGATGVTLGDVPGGLIDVRKAGREETRAAAARQTTGDIFGDFDEPESPRTPTEEIEMELPAPVEPLVEERRRPVWPFVVGGVVLLVAGAGVGYFVMAHLGAGEASPGGAKIAAAEAPRRANRVPEPALPPEKEARTAKAAAAGAPPMLASALPTKDERIGGAAATPDGPKGGAPLAAASASYARGGASGKQAAKSAGTSPSKPTAAKASRERSKAKSRGERTSREHKVASRAVKKSPRGMSLERARSATAAVVRRTSSPGAPKKAASREATALLEVLTASEAHHQASAKPAPHPQAGASAVGSTAQDASHSMRPRLSSSQVRRSLARRQKAMAQCYAGEASGAVLVRVKLDIAGSGKVLTASVTGGLSDPKAAGCIERVLRRTKFPPFQQSHQIVTTAVRIR